jgi:hypothetical protein
VAFQQRVIAFDDINLHGTSASATVYSTPVDPKALARMALS